jgi:hypothetical protein
VAGESGVSDIFSSSGTSSTGSKWSFGPMFASADEGLDITVMPSRSIVLDGHRGGDCEAKGLGFAVWLLCGGDGRDGGGGGDAGSFVSVCGERRVLMAGGCWTIVSFCQVSRDSLYFSKPSCTYVESHTHRCYSSL